MGCDNDLEKLKQTGKVRQRLWDFLLLSTYCVSGTALVSGDDSNEQNRQNTYIQRAYILKHDNKQKKRVKHIVC